MDNQLRKQSFGRVLRIHKMNARPGVTRSRTDPLHAFGKRELDAMDAIDMIIAVSTALVVLAALLYPIDPGGSGR